MLSIAVLFVYVNEAYSSDAGNFFSLPGYMEIEAQIKSQKTFVDTSIAVLFVSVNEAYSSDAGRFCLLPGHMEIQAQIKSLEAQIKSQSTFVDPSIVVLFVSVNEAYSSDAGNFCSGYLDTWRCNGHSCNYYQVQAQIKSLIGAMEIEVFES